MESVRRSIPSGGLTSTTDCSEDLHVLEMIEHLAGVFRLEYVE